MKEISNAVAWMLSGAIIALCIDMIVHNHHSPLKPSPSVTRPAPVVSASAEPAPQPIEKRLNQHTEQELWLQRRDLEFDKCATLHGTPTLGFGMRVVCLDSHAVKFLGEEHPPYE